MRNSIKHGDTLGVTITILIVSNDGRINLETMAEEKVRKCGAVLDKRRALISVQIRIVGGMVR